jgi:tRNA(Arg) A34 adenosine deaminase TadA
MLPRTQTAADFDRAMMERCIALAIQAVDFGEYPYAAVVCRNGEVVCESINSVREDHDVTHHAEVVALRQALGSLRRASLEAARSTRTPNRARCVATRCARPVSAGLSSAFRRR